MSSLHWYPKMRMPASSGESVHHAMVDRRVYGSACGSEKVRSQRPDSLTLLRLTAWFVRLSPFRFGMGSVGRGRFGRPGRNSFPVFDFPAPIQSLRRTENPRVDGSIDSDRCS